MKTAGCGFLLFLFFFYACDKQSTTPNTGKIPDPKTGIMKVTLDMTTAPSEVVRLEGRLENDNDNMILFDFEIDNNMAKAFVESIHVGLWRLTINTFDKRDNILYSGSTMVEVIPGVITPVSIHLESATGSISITVTWGNLCIDFDGNIYKTVKIGDQTWMAENLKVTHYRNGDAIPQVAGNSEWSELVTGAYCNSPLDQDYAETYGRLFNWYAVNDGRNIAPKGWHVPTDDEWKELEMYLGMSQAVVDLSGMRGTNEGGKLKETGTDYWRSPNTGATNESRFSALGGGGRDYSGFFFGLGEDEDWWSSTAESSTHAWSRGLDFNRSDIDRCSDVKQCGFSVRCVKDKDDDDNFEDDEFEENDTRSNAKILLEYTYYHDLFVSNLDEDWYSLTLSADSLSILCKFDHILGDINMELVNRDGRVLASSKSQTDNEEIHFIVKQLDTYFIHIYLSSGQSNTYTFWWDDIWQGE